MTLEEVEHGPLRAFFQDDEVALSQLHPSVGHSGSTAKLELVPRQHQRDSGCTVLAPPLPVEAVRLPPGAEHHRLVGQPPGCCAEALPRFSGLGDCQRLREVLSGLGPSPGLERMRPGRKVILVARRTIHGRNAKPPKSRASIESWVGEILHRVHADKEGEDIDRMVRQTYRPPVTTLFADASSFPTGSALWIGPEVLAELSQTRLTHDVGALAEQ